MRYNNNNIALSAYFVCCVCQLKYNFSTNLIYCPYIIFGHEDWEM